MQLKINIITKEVTQLEISGTILKAVLPKQVFKRSLDPSVLGNIISILYSSPFFFSSLLHASFSYNIYTHHPNLSV